MNKKNDSEAHPIANSDSWKILPMPVERVCFPLAAHYTTSEFEKICAGHIPKGRDDKWFVYFKEPWLFFHASQSGDCIYQVRFIFDHDGMTVSEAWRPGSEKKYSLENKKYDAYNLGSLIDKLLYEPPFEDGLEKLTVAVKRNDETIENCLVEIIRPVVGKILFTGCGYESLAFERSDLFKAQCALRRELEKKGCQLLCAGARIDVFPSRMCQDMGRGRKAYIQGVNATHTKNDLIDIFSYASPELVGSVEEQLQFHRDLQNAPIMDPNSAKPSQAEIKKAAQNPLGKIYRIAGEFPKNMIPDEAIIGAWQVDAEGRISGNFVPNPDYNVKQWPASRWLEVELDKLPAKIINPSKEHANIKTIGEWKKMLKKLKP